MEVTSMAEHVHMQSQHIYNSLQTGIHCWVKWKLYLMGAAKIQTNVTNNYHGKQAKYKHSKPISCASIPNSTWTQLQ